MQDRLVGCSRRIALTTLVVTLVAGGLSVTTPAGAAPGVVVAPNTNLRDGQAVVVALSGFPTGSYQGALQCRAGATALDDCDTSSGAYAEIGDGGGAHASLRVATLLYGSSGGPSDCRVDGCEIVVLDAGEGAVFDGAARVPLAFDPAGPLLPAPVATVTPGTNLHDGQVVSVHGTGFRSEYVTVAQCAAAPAPFGACDLGGQTYAEAPDGTFTENHVVYSAVASPDGQIDCREDASCVLVVSPGSYLPRADSAVIPLAFDPAGPLPPVPTVTAEPTTHLRDGQLLTVTGSGYRPDAFVNVYQCAEGGERCAWYTAVYPAVDDEGRFSTAFAVDTVFTALTETDCRVEACVLRVATSGGGGAEISIPLTFDPDAPLRPPPVVTVEPTTDLADGASVHVSGTGFPPNRYVGVELCPVGDVNGRCDTGSVYVYPGADGKLDATLTAWIDIVNYEGIATSCDLAPGCEIVVRNERSDAVFRAPISFGPRPPARGRYFDPVFDDVVVQRDIVYRSTADSEGNPVDLKIDVYQPVGDVAPVRPAMVWFHGGYFAFGDKRDMESYARAFARRGYVTASVQYRLRPEIGSTIDARTGLALLDAYDDADAAIAWLREHRHEYRIDRKAISAGGYSAGAVTSLNLAYLPGQRGPANSRVAAAVSIAGLSVGSPGRGEPPALMFHGTQDTTVPYSAGENTCDSVNAAKRHCELVSYAGSGHEIVSSRQRDIERRTADFLGAQVLEPLGFLRPEPLADAGGPYAVSEGGSVMLDGTGSRAASGGALVSSWNPTDKLRNARTARPTFVARDDGTDTVTLDLREGRVGSLATTTVRTTNVAPSFDTVATKKVSGQTRRYTVVARVLDPGLDDTHGGIIDWGDGQWSVTTVKQTRSAAVLRASHTYGRAGDFIVGVLAFDDDGGTTTTTRHLVVG